MTRMVTFEERVWTITTQPRVEGGTRAPGEQEAISHMGGLRFLSDKGDKHFLPLEGRQLLTDKDLHALSLDGVAGFLKRAKRERSAIIAPEVLQSRLPALAKERGATLSADEMTALGETYLRCLGKDQWDVRAYAGSAGAGAREYRVIRGTGVQDVYRTTDRQRADGVRVALNDLESEVSSGA